MTVSHIWDRAHLTREQWRNRRRAAIVRAAARRMKKDREVAAKVIAPTSKVPSPIAPLFAPAVQRRRRAK